MNDNQLSLQIAELLDEKKGESIVILDLRGRSNLTDFVIIATGRNERHASALADHVEKSLHEQGVKLHHKEGQRTGDWVVLDYLQIIVHIFNEDKRHYYNLERLWSDAPRLEPTFLTA